MPRASYFISAEDRADNVNRIGRRTILAMLLIVAFAIIWNVLGGR